MMVNLLVAFVLFIATISGSSKLLIGLSSALIILLTTKNTFRIDLFFPERLSVSKNKMTVLLSFAIVFFILPVENLIKLFTTLFSIFVTYLIVNKVYYFSPNKQKKLYLFLIIFILMGDLIHLSGILGPDMNLFKQIVGFEELSNLERERSLSILGLRYSGWFAEPSYHGAYTGIICGLFWMIAGRYLALIPTVIFFVLCPTPMMLLAFASSILFLTDYEKINLKYIKIVIPIFVSIIFVIFIFQNRIFALLNSVSDISYGIAVNTSEANRLVWPIISLYQHINDQGIFSPASLSCIENDTCLFESFKIPIITYLIYFGGIGTFLIFAYLVRLYNSSYLKVFTVLLFASLLSSGGGFVIHSGLIVAIILVYSNTTRKLKVTI